MALVQAQCSPHLDSERQTHTAQVILLIKRDKNLKQSGFSVQNRGLSFELYIKIVLIDYCIDHSN